MSLSIFLPRWLGLTQRLGQGRDNTDCHPIPSPWAHCKLQWPNLRKAGQGQLVESIMGCSLRWRLPHTQQEKCPPLWPEVTILPRMQSRKKNKSPRLLTDPQTSTRVGATRRRRNTQPKILGLQMENLGTLNQNCWFLKMWIHRVLIIKSI